MAVAVAAAAADGEGGGGGGCLSLLLPVAGALEQVLN